MLNITLTDEQVFSLIEQLPKEKRKELMEHLLFEEWLESPEALKLKEDSEKAVKEGRLFTTNQIREKLRAHGKNV